MCANVLLRCANYTFLRSSVGGTLLYFELSLQRQYCNEYWHKHYSYSVEQLNYRVERWPSRVLVWITNQVSNYCDCMSLSLLLTLHLDVFLGIVPCASAVRKMVCKEQSAYHSTHQHACDSGWTQQY